jgi:hypothetical protein
MTRTKGLPNFTNSARTRTESPQRTTGKKITKPNASIPNRRLNTPTKLFSGRKNPTESP